MQQLQQAAHSLVHRIDVPARQGPAEEHPALHRRHPALVAQLRETLGQKITHQAKVLGEQRRIHLWHVPTRQEAVNPVHEGGIVTHLGWQRAKQMADTLLMLDIHVEVADQHDGAVGADALLAARELARLHVALHDVDAVLLVEGHA